MVCDKGELNRNILDIGLEFFLKFLYQLAEKTVNKYMDLHPKDNFQICGEYGK